ncbi:heterokaryon incompatibility protein-domain-containing protein [Whalleya microplaca]|nr:heterokaryon incompatibility protein-domain-containing protein [Whalleya microplaca]
MDRSIDRELGFSVETEQVRQNTPSIMANETPPLVSPSTSLGPESSRDSLGIGWRSPASDSAGTSSRTSSPPRSSRMPPTPSPRSLTGLGLFRNYASKSTISLMEYPTEAKDADSLYSLEEEGSTDSFTRVDSNLSQHDSVKSKKLSRRLRFSKPSGELIRRRIQNMGEVAEQVKGDLRDITKSAQEAIKPNSSGLCEACEKIPFDRPPKEDGAVHHAKVEQEIVETEVIASLHRVLQNRAWCKFCRTLFTALSVEDNDPLRHPAVQNHIQSELKGKTFAEWAEEANFLKRHTSSQTIWPFGHKSILKDKEESDLGTYLDELDLEETVTSDFSSETVSIASSSTMSKSEAAKDIVARALDDTMDSISSRVRRIKRPLPVWIFIKAYANTHPEAGTFVVNVQGQGREPDASMTLLSSFNLRVASSKYKADKESGDLRYGRVLDPQRIDLSLCNRWLEHCEYQHGLACSQPGWSKSLEKPSGVGFRVVDVVDEKIVEFPKPGECDYVTLSYVWGGYTTVQLLQSNITHLSRRGGLSEAKAGLPETVRSAMRVTKELGKRYLWVDSLCIVQDSDDKVAQLGQMDRIYGNSAVTIVAADGGNANSGLDGVSKPSSRREEQGQIVEEIAPGVKVLIPIKYRPKLKPWETRAWTFQEKLLSKRLLIFSQGHVYFHCRHGVHMEDMTAKEAGTGPRQISWLSLPEDEVTSLKSSIDRDVNGALHIRRSPAFEQYADLIAQYTSRYLSFSNDILNAIMGLITILDGSRLRNSNRDPGGETLYGLPTEFLDLGILWQPAAGKDVRLRRRILVDQNQKPLEDKHQMPSWSWAAWEAVTEGERAYSSGVRYEQPFTLVSDPLEQYRVKKVLESIDDEAEERVKPLLRWYRFTPLSKPPDQPQSQPPSPAKTSSTWSFSQALFRPITKAPPSPIEDSSNKPDSEIHGELKPVNNTGLGLSSDSAQTLQDWRQAHKTPFHSAPLTIHDLPPSALASLDARHLLFRSSTAQFRLGNKTLRAETLYTYSTTTANLEPAQQLWIHEIEILDAKSFAVGRATLHDAMEVVAPAACYDFVVLSEAQYFGNEERGFAGSGGDEYPLYNVMMVRWDERRPHFATRVAMGKIYKDAWMEAGPTDRVVILE